MDGNIYIYLSVILPLPDSYCIIHSETAWYIIFYSSVSFYIEICFAINKETND